jgi:hypothetical protein
MREPERLSDGSKPAGRRTGAGRFLRENWLYVVAPILVVIVILIALYFLGGGSDSSPFVYPIF